MKHFAAVDLFCGAGGLTYGLRQAGISVVVGVDMDPSCRYPIESNNKGTCFVERNVIGLTASEVAAWYPAGSIRVLTGCAPCQPFSKYTVRAGEDDRWRLLNEFLRLVQETRPHVVSMENVPQLKTQEHSAYLRFVSGLEAAGYRVWADIVRCADYGVPQTRERLVLLAGADGRQVSLIPPTARTPKTVQKAIGTLPPIVAGGDPHPEDSLHIASHLSELNRKRIRATPEGGGWKNWPTSLRLTCHQRSSGRYYGSVYGRMAWNEPAPTMTTQCFGYGNGRFGHPEQDRAISLREAAMLQTFPRSYRFVPPDEPPTFKNVGKHIGNAVPVALGRAIGKSIVRAFKAGSG
jgi:DNA (cytosine-5)-methyltransferase 1